MPPISIFACESQPIVLEGLEKVLSLQPDLIFAGARPNISEAIDTIQQLDPDILLLDQGSGLKGALQFVSDVRAMAPRTQCVLWVHELADVESFRVLQMGARGVLKKSLPVSSLLECLRAVAGGTVWMETPMPVHDAGPFNRRSAPRLTPREREIVRLVCRGLKNKQIAESLGITPGTVKVHLMHIFEKTNIKDRFELAIHGRRLAGDAIEDNTVREPMAQVL